MIKCTDCGACCKVMTIKVNMPSLEAVELINLREDIEITPEGLIVVYSPCRYLKDNKCIVFDDAKRRPELCKRFIVDGSDCRFARKLFKLP